MRDVVLCLDFDERRDWFYSKLENIKKQYANDRTTISVDRQSVVQDSCGIVNVSYSASFYMSCLKSDIPHRSELRRPWERRRFEGYFVCALLRRSCNRKV